jgi:DNA-binding transcriptional LysR family regulator
MRFNGLDLNLLVALDALLSEQNVSAAGQRIHLSQSAMSGALARLRDYFGDELLVSHGRRMLLTPKAESLIVPLQNALMHIRSVIATDQSFDPLSTQRRLSVASSDYALAVLLAPALVELDHSAPGLSFDFTPVGRDAIEQLESGNLDLLVTLEQYLSPDHPRQYLFEDDYVAIAWEQNSRIGDELTRDLYFELDHVSVRFQGDRNPAFESWVKQSALQHRSVDIVVPSFAVIPMFVIGTDRIATIQRSLAQYFATLHPLRIMPAPLPVPRARQMVQWHQLNDGDDGIRWVVDHLVASASEFPRMALKTPA